jgi:hypothetical protein
MSSLYEMKSNQREMLKRALGAALIGAGLVLGSAAQAAENVRWKVLFEGGNDA